MFSSVNFLFLISLAFISWIILCYFKQIQEQRVEEINHTNYIMERTFEETSTTPCRDNYDMYFNFFCIFTCLYALARITNMTEHYIAKQMHRKFGGGSNKRSENVSDSDMKNDQNEAQTSELIPNELVTPTINEMIAQQKKFLSQIQLLKQQNEQLEQRLQEANEVQQSSNNFLILRKKVAGDVAGDMEDIKKESNVRCRNQIYISNSHFHMNRQVYVNEGNIKLDLKNLQQSDSGDFSQIWQKYLQMQKYAIRTQGTSGAENSDDGENLMPVVVSTEELQSIQGLY